MSFQMRWLRFKANRDMWERRVSAAAAVLFAAAAAVNAGPLFCGGGVTALGAVCSRLYLAVWFSAAVFLRNRAGWVRAACIVRWTAAASVLLGAAASGGDGLFSALCVVPYAVFISVYGGLGRRAWVYFVLLSVQALVASGLSLRLRRKRRAAGGTWTDTERIE